jgi:D-amino-acid dehydrogenase
MQLYENLVKEEGLDCEWQKKGLLFVYRKQKLLDEFASVNELLSSEFNEPARRLNGDELANFEPTLQDGLAGAWYYEHEAHLRPDRLLVSWRSVLEKRGVRFVENCELQRFEEDNGSVSLARTTVGEFRADVFVVATGAWTPKLARILHERIPIEPGKGYSITLPPPDNGPKTPMIFPEHRVVVTPMESGLRIGSIMEFAGYDERIHPNRIRLLTDGASHYLRDRLGEHTSEEWYGWRPMTYDSTPVIGACPSFSNVYLATGHNMLGLSMAPATGRLVTELITAVKPHVTPQPYSAGRFRV